MKKIPIIAPVFLIVLFILSITTVFAASSDFLQRATETYQRLCTRRNVSLQNAISCYAFDKLSELNQAIDGLDSRLDTTEAIDATQSAKIAELEQRIVNLENQPSPSPTPTVLLNDDFNGPNLNQDIWDVFPNGGTYSFENGYIVIPGGSAIPFFRTKGNHFPDTQPFQVEFGMQYTSASPSGSGVALTFTQQGNSPNPPNYPIQFWQDSASGLSVVKFGLTVATLGGINTNYHIVKIVYDGQKYLVYLDGNPVYTSPNSNIAGGLWFGHPSVSVDTPWTGFKLDYIKATLL